MTEKGKRRASSDRPGGSFHYNISHPKGKAIQTVPSRRPIKPVYIRKFVAMIDQVRSLP